VVAELELELVPVALLAALASVEPPPVPVLLEPLDTSEPELLAAAELELPAPGELELEAGVPVALAPLSELPLDGAVAVVAQP
jgi:hypothetical protein